MSHTTRTQEGYYDCEQSMEDTSIRQNPSSTRPINTPPEPSTVVDNETDTTRSLRRPFAAEDAQLVTRIFGKEIDSMMPILQDDVKGVLPSTPEGNSLLSRYGSKKIADKVRSLIRNMRSKANRGGARPVAKRTYVIIVYIYIYV